MSSSFEQILKSGDRRRVLLRADAGSRIGFGHFVRSCALGAYLKDDFHCVITTRNPDLGLPSAYQHSLARESGIDLVPSVGKTREEFDPVFLDMILEDDIVVLDNYYYETSFQNEVKRRCTALVCVDDMHDRHFTADLVMTFCPLSRERFSMEPEAKFVGGMEWSFLRRPFLRPMVPRKRTPESPSKVAVAMGGADPLGLTSRLVGMVHEIKPSVEIEVLAGQTVKIDFEESETLKLHRQASAAEIADMFDRCDIGIFPASTVCVEAFSRGLPVAAGYFVDNQEEIYAYGVAHGWFVPLGDLRASGDALEARLQKALCSVPTPAPGFDFNARRHDIIALFRSLAR